MYLSIASRFYIVYVQTEQAKAVRKKLRSYNIVTSFLLYLYIGHLFSVNPSLTQSEAFPKGIIESQALGDVGC